MRPLVLLVAILAATAAARADDWARPSTKYIKSDSGRYRAIVVPGGPKRASSITMYDDKDPVHPKRLYQRAAVARVAPVHIFVTDGGELVTVDEWQSAGYLHALVIYDRKGKVVVDCALEQILLPEELPNVEQTASSRWWRAKEGPMWLEPGAMLIKSAWGPVLRFDLATGAQTRDGQRVVIPGYDRCRVRKK